MGKPKLFVDFDGTLVNSTKAFSHAYNILYEDHPNFEPADYTKLSKYNFEDICPLVKNPLDIFENKLFFKDLEFINDNTYDVLERLNEKYQIIVVTVGTPLNLAYKALWLQENITFINDYVLLYNDGCVMNKSVVNMTGEGNVFLDDIPSNLLSVKCETKIMFGKVYPWSDGWNGDWCANWSDVEERFL